MQVAIMSDIHGFPLALDSVLGDIDAHGGIDRIIAAGDLCEGGPDPNGVLERLGTSRVELVQGNTDRDLAASSRESRLAWWTAEALGDEGLRFLGGLPFQIRITPPGAAPFEHDLLIVHANPTDMDRHLAPDLPEDEVLEMIGSAKAEVIAFGHIHISYIRQVGDVTLVDVSAVGNPKDGDLRSRWGLVTWDQAKAHWSVELRFVDYPLEETVLQIRDSAMPKADSVIRKLKRAAYED